MVADCYLWEDYSNESLELLEDNDGQKDVSMEIEVLDSQYNSSEKVLDINKFKFRAVTVLGSDVVQGMNGTCNLNLYTNNNAYSDFIKQMENKINNFKKEDDIMAKPVEPVIEQQPNSLEFGLSVENITDQAYNQISSQTITKTDYWGDEYEARLYWYRDLLPSDNVVVVEASSDYSYYGIPYSVNGDTVTLDFENKKEYISEWKEKTGTDNNALLFDLERDEMKDVVLAKFQEKESEINDINSELEGLKVFKQSIDDANYKAEIEDVISKFALEEDEISEFKEKVMNREISKDQFTKELYAIQGMKYIENMKNKKFSSNNKELDGVIVKINHQEEPKAKPYGGILG